jgi:hypothetical protein
MLNKYNKLNYYLYCDYISKYNVNNIYLIPKITSLTLTLHQEELTEGNLILSDLNHQIKMTVLFYALINKIPKIKSISRFKFKKQGESKYSYIQEVCTKNVNDINNILILFFLGQDLKFFFEDVLITNDSIANKTMVILKYPAILLKEAVELDNFYDILLKEFYFSISITYNKILTKNEILDLLYFG